MGSTKVKDYGRDIDRVGLGLGHGRDEVAARLSRLLQRSLRGLALKRRITVASK